MIPGILRQAIEAQPKARFERAHFKSFGDASLLFEAAFYFSDPDYNRYMDIQQAINLAVYARLQKEGIAPVRPPPATADDPKEGARAPRPPARARQPETKR